MSSLKQSIVNSAISSVSTKPYRPNGSVASLLSGEESNPVLTDNFLHEDVVISATVDSRYTRTTSNSNGTFNETFDVKVPVFQELFTGNAAYVIRVLAQEINEQKGAAHYWQQRFAQANAQRIAAQEALAECQNPEVTE